MINTDFDLECCVCLEPTDKKTSCGHSLCSNCEHMNPQKNCPMCRGSLLPDTSDTMVFNEMVLQCDLHKVTSWYYICNPNISPETMMMAAKGGKMDTVMWLHEQVGYAFLSEEIVTYAVESGNLDMVKWLRDQGYSWGCSTTRMSVTNNYPHILRWLLDNGCSWDSSIKNEIERLLSKPSAPPAEAVVVAEKSPSKWGCVIQ